MKGGKCQLLLMTKNQHVHFQHDNMTDSSFQCEFLKAGMSELYSAGLLEELASSCDRDT